MWTDRYTVYYSRDKQFAVRCLAHGRPEEEAQYKKFDEELEARRFFNAMLEEHGARCRVELFFSQAKWMCEFANHDQFGDPVLEPVGLGPACRRSDHVACQDEAQCACPCHITEK